MGVCVLNAIFAFMNGFLIQTPSVFLGIFMFPDSSAGKESACSAGDPSLIPVLGRHPGEGTGYPLQNSQTSLVTQTVKTLPAVQEIWVQKIPWRRAWQPTPVFLPGESPWAEELGGLQFVGSQRAGDD